MQQYGRSEFADKFAEVAADSDYSRLPTLRDFSQYDIRAAAEAMWAEATKRGWDRDEMYRILDSATVERVLSKRVARYTDSNELVSVEFEEYWDATDLMGFSAGLREGMEEELVRRFANRKRASGLTVIENQHGIWIFAMKEAI